MSGAYRIIEADSVFLEFWNCRVRSPRGRIARTTQEDFASAIGTFLNTIQLMYILSFQLNIKLLWF